MNASPPRATELLIIGAGICGMTAAREWSQAGRQVMVLDKGRSVGGRMASRRIGEAVFDHGAQFITARSERFLKRMEECETKGIVSKWCRGFHGQSEGHPRWRGCPDMTALTGHLAQGSEVLLETRVSSIGLAGKKWQVTLDDGTTITSESLLLTAPVPQALELLAAGNFEQLPEVKASLEALEYERCLAVLAVLDGPSGISPPGGMPFENGPVAWLADNHLKGISPVPCITLHASPAFSLAYWNDDRIKTGQFLLEAAAPWIRSGVKAFQTHGWKFSKPTQILHQPFAILHANPPLLIAGDAFGGPKVEGAASSGWAAVGHLLNSPSRPT